MTDKEVADFYKYWFNNINTQEKIMRLFHKNCCDLVPTNPQIYNNISICDDDEEWMKLHCDEDTVEIKPETHKCICPKENFYYNGIGCRCQGT